MDSGLTLLDIRNARDGTETPAAMEQVLAAMGDGGPGGVLSWLFRRGQGKYVSLEIVSVNTRINFFIAVRPTERHFLESQLTAQYPRVLIQESKDYAPHFLELPHASGQLTLSGPFYIPLKMHTELTDLDILAGVLGQLAKLPSDQAAAIQLHLEPAGTKWQQTCASVIQAGVPDPNGEPGSMKAHPHAAKIEEKIAQTGYLASLRILTVAQDAQTAEGLLSKLAGAYGVFTSGEGNGLHLVKPSGWRVRAFEQSLVTRTAALRPRFQVLGSREIASLWHPPAEALAAIKNIRWGATLTGEAPENLPVATEDEDEKKRINFFARTEFKNTPTTFGIKKADRRKHMYIIGKTGSGKSTMIANMAINDMRNGEGVAVIDPHGDLCDILLDYVPSFRINDVVYLDPSDIANPFRLNPLQLVHDSHRDLVASGIVSIFHKLYGHSWGPRLEYILRNTILTLLHVPDATLLQVSELLTNAKYRTKVAERLPDRVLRDYWLNEFNKMNDRLRTDAISPILNKVGQFLSAQAMRSILGHPKSTVNLETIMNEGKILMVNLSQGKLGEDNSALLGAMVITKMQLAVMNRVHMEEKDRRDFYLYVDEFQNFATDAFIKILSEARKYRLNLALANQYIGQIEEDIQKAIFGNVGSLVSFGVGAADAQVLTREFSGKYQEEELVGLGNFQIAAKLSIDNHTSQPFTATTLPLPRSKNQNRDKVLRSSRERYTKKAK